jgi:hypothetical protein
MLASPARMEEPPPTSTPPALRCLRGRSATPEIIADLRNVSRLPGPARQQLYRVLGPCLVEPVPRAAEERLDQFCQEFQVPGDDLARAVRACRFLLRQAAMLDLGTPELVEDLRRLGDTGEIEASLVPGYEMAKKVVRDEIARAVLADHGKVVERVGWRVEQITASNRGAKLRLPLTVLTLAYREGDRRDRITLQLTTEALRELRAMCDELL